MVLEHKEVVIACEIAMACKLGMLLQKEFQPKVV